MELALLDYFSELFWCFSKWDERKSEREIAMVINTI